jgi:RNA polymerase sigma-70 factor (ECF subfamily)
MHYEMLNLTNIVNSIAVNNSEVAYQQLFKVLFSPLKRFAYSLLKSTQLSEEVASDVIITLWKNRQKLPQISNIQVYAFVVARNLSLNILKQNSKRHTISLCDLDIEISIPDSSPEQILISEELRRKLEDAIQCLPSRCKLVFKLVREDGFSYKEVAEILNISVKTVDAHLVTAVRKLAVSVKAEFNLT